MRGWPNRAPSADQAQTGRTPCGTGSKACAASFRERARNCCRISALERSCALRLVAEQPPTASRRCARLSAFGVHVARCAETAGMCLRPRLTAPLRLPGRPHAARESIPAPGRAGAWMSRAGQRFDPLVTPAPRQRPFFLLTRRRGHLQCSIPAHRPGLVGGLARAASGCRVGHCCCSSVVERLLGKEEVMGSIPISSYRRYGSTVWAGASVRTCFDERGRGAATPGAPPPGRLVESFSWPKAFFPEPNRT